MLPAETVQGIRPDRLDHRSLPSRCHSV